MCDVCPSHPYSPFKPSRSSKVITVTISLLAALLREEKDPALSSKSVQGSISNSLSCCIDFPDALLSATLDRAGLLKMVAEQQELKPEIVLLA